MLEKVTTMENLIVVEIVDGKKMDSIVAVSQGGRKLQVSIRIIIVTTLLHPPFIRMVKEGGFHKMVVIISGHRQKNDSILCLYGC